MNVCPATVIVPDREPVPELELTLKLTVPLPERGLSSMEIQLDDVLGDHEQPLCVCTEKLPGPPLDPKLWLVGDSEYEQETPDWLTVNVRPPAVMVPDRELVLELALTLKLTVPLPEPDPDVIEIQLAEVLADHGQPLCVCTEKLPEPLLAPNCWLVGDSV